VTAHVELPAGQLKSRQNARLLSADGKAIPAQITVASQHADGSAQQIALGFNLSPAPLETTKLSLEYGENVRSLEPKQGLTFAETAEGYQVSAYTIRKDAQPLISSVRYGREYLKQGGLNVGASAGEVEYSLRRATRSWKVEQQGPLQVRLRCDGHYLGEDGAAQLPFSITLEFVSSKSWVRVRQSADTKAAGDKLVALHVTGDFQLSGRLLWDTDVGYWLYGVLEAPEQMIFAQQEKAWLCKLGKAGQEILYATSLPVEGRSKGWGHFQEAKESGNVIAFGFAGQAPSREYSCSLSGDGKLRYRDQASTAGPAQLDAFFHFIPVPAQHTARTSPAAMMAPLEVTYPRQ
jgi:hypothetical protein